MVDTGPEQYAPKQSPDRFVYGAMKSRPLTYLLLAFAVVLWVVIIRRVVSYTDSGGMPAQTVQENIPREPPTKDFLLSLDYRDPFGETAALRKTPVTRNPRHLPEPEFIPDPPPVQFRGVIRQQGKLYAILEYESYSGIFLQGDTLTGCRVTAVTADSVVLQYGKHRFIAKH